MKEFFKYLINGIFKENPVLVLMIGLCSVLAVSTTVENAIGMGLAFSFVMIFSNLFVSSLRPIIPNNIRIPIFIVVIATFTTIVDLIISAYFPELYKALGIFIPLIVVNCIIIGRAEGFAYKHNVVESLADGVGISIGYIWAIVALGLIREFLGSGTVLDKVIIQSFNPAKVFSMPPGAFWGIALLMGILKWVQQKISRR